MPSFGRVYQGAVAEGEIGDKERYREAALRPDPGEGEVLICVHAPTVKGIDRGAGYKSA